MVIYKLIEHYLQKYINQIKLKIPKPIPMHLKLKKSKLEPLTIAWSINIKFD